VYVKSVTGMEINVSDAHLILIGMEKLVLDAMEIEYGIH
jgi:hypothetical protein